MSDEAARHRRAHELAFELPGEPSERQQVELDPAEAWDLLREVEYGRVVFTLGALPAVRPVNHLIDGGDIVIRTRLTASVSEAVGPHSMTVVAYQADQIDARAQLGWSVVVTGYARTVTDPAEVARLEGLLEPWVTMAMDTVIRIHPEIITGFFLTPVNP